MAYKPHTTEEERAAIIDMLRAGYSIRRVAAATGRSKQTICKYLRRLRNGTLGNRRRLVTEYEKTIVRMMSEQGYAPHEIAGAIGRTTAIVRYIRSKIFRQRQRYRRASFALRWAVAYALGRGASIDDVCEHFGIARQNVRRLIARLAKPPSQCSECGRTMRGDLCAHCRTRSARTYSIEQIGWRCGCARRAIEMRQPLTQACFAVDAASLKTRRSQAYVSSLHWES